MPPRIPPVPRGTFASHAKHLQKRRCLFNGQRFASSDTASLWRGRDPITRLGQSITGGMEWQTSTYSFNKQNSKTLPVAATNVEKLIQAFVTSIKLDTRGQEARAVRSALNTRRKSAEQVYASKPRIKDYGDRVEMTVFVYQHILPTPTRGSPGAAAAAAQARAEQMRIICTQTAGLESLLSRIYSKPVSLRMVSLAHAHLDADILSRLVAQQLRDRRISAARAVRDATWKTALPDARTVTAIRQTKQRLTRSSLTWRDLTVGATEATSAAKIVGTLGLSRVSSVQVEADGRLTKRITANRTQRKMARNGASSKGAARVLRGTRKAHVKYAFATGKRRVGQYGVKVFLGHT